VIAKQVLDTQRATAGSLEGALKADQAAIDNAKLQLTYARVTAPIGGRAGLRQIDAGNIIHAGDPNGLVTIEQLQPLNVLFTITADNLPPVLKKLKAGERPLVEAWDREDRNKLATGTLLAVDNQIDVTTGTTRLKAVFPNTDGALFPNQFVNCHMLLGTKQHVAIVPPPAIQHGPQGPYVYVGKPDGTATMRPVTPGVSEGPDVSIEKGVAAGEIVVVDGQDKLQEGAKVDARTADSKSGERRSKK